jgi:hypothetical protein
MRTSRRLWLSTAIGTVLPNARTATDTDPRNCTAVQAALRAYDEITPGVKRRDVERAFLQGGGAQFRDHARYIYRACEYITVDIEYTLNSGNNGHASDAADDIVRSKSRLFLDYPSRD